MDDTIELSVSIDTHLRTIDKLVMFIDSSIALVDAACSGSTVDVDTLGVTLNALAYSTGLTKKDQQLMSANEISVSPQYTQEGFKSTLIRAYNKLVELAITAKNMIVSFIKRLFGIGEIKSESITVAIKELDANAAKSDAIMASEGVAAGESWPNSAISKAATDKVKLITDNDNLAVRSTVAFSDMSAFCGQKGDAKLRTIHALAHNGQLVSIQNNIRETLAVAKDVLVAGECDEILTVIREFTSIRKMEDIERFMTKVAPTAKQDNIKRVGNYRKGKMISAKTPTEMIYTTIGRPMCGGAVMAGSLLSFGPFTGSGFRLLTQPDLYALGAFSLNFDTYRLPNKVKVKSFNPLPRGEIDSLMVCVAELATMANQFKERHKTASDKVANFVKSGDYLASIEENITKAGADYRHKGEVKTLISMVSKLPKLVRHYTETYEIMAAYLAGLHVILVTHIEDCVDNAVIVN